MILNFIRAFFADRFFGSLAFATLLFMAVLAWMTVKEFFMKRWSRERRARRYNRYAMAR